jgi:hypothetical protein
MPPSPGRNHPTGTVFASSKIRLIWLKPSLAPRTLPDCITAAREQFGNKTRLFSIGIGRWSN